MLDFRVAVVFPSNYSIHFLGLKASFISHKFYKSKPKPKVKHPDTNTNTNLYIYIYFYLSLSSPIPRRQPIRRQQIIPQSHMRHKIHPISPNPRHRLRQHRLINDLLRPAPHKRQQHKVLTVPVRVVERGAAFRARDVVGPDLLAEDVVVVGCVGDFVGAG